MTAFLLTVAELIGAWRGESVCTQRPSACNDEHVVYHVTAGKEPATLSIQANKIVDGKEVEMGTLECSVARAEIRCVIPKGVFEFHVAGSEMTGTLRLTDGTLFRRISVKR